MSRMLGTVSMGVRAPIIRQGDNLAEIVTGSILEAIQTDGLTPFSSMESISIRWLPTSSEG